MRTHLRTLGCAIAVIGALAGCATNTAEGVRQDTTIVGEAARDTSARTVSIARRALNASTRWLSSVLRGTGNALVRGSDRLQTKLDRSVK